MQFCALFEVFLLVVSIFCWISLYVNKGICFNEICSPVVGLQLKNKHFLLIFGFILSCIIVLPNIVFIAIRLCSSSIDKNIVMTLSMMFAEILSLIAIMTIYKKLKYMCKTTISEVLQAIKVGLRYFILSLPIVYLVSILWVVFLLFLNKIGLKIDLSTQFALKLFISESVFVKWLLGISIVILAPIVEECFFRGIVYRAFKFRTSKTVAIILSGLIFAALHLNVIASIPIFVLGIFLTNAYEKSGCLVSSITMHALFNLNTLFCLVMSSDQLI